MYIRRYVCALKAQTEQLFVTVIIPILHSPALSVYNYCHYLAGKWGFVIVCSVCFLYLVAAAKGTGFSLFLPAVAAKDSGLAIAVWCGWSTFGFRGKLRSMGLWVLGE